MLEPVRRAPEPRRTEKAGADLLISVSDAVNAHYSRRNTGALSRYPEEITYKKIPADDPNREQTAKSREMIEEFVRRNHAKLWIQHDYTAGIKRKIAPAFYD
jgi:hypothetical protein